MSHNETDRAEPEGQQVEQKGKQQQGEHTPYLAPLDGQARTGNMGIFLDQSEDLDAKKKQIFLVIIVCLAVISLIWKLVVFDMDKQESLREERRAKAAEFQRLIDGYERSARQSSP